RGPERPRPPIWWAPRLCVRGDARHHGSPGGDRGAAGLVTAGTAAHRERGAAPGRARDATGAALVSRQPGDLDTRLATAFLREWACSLRHTYRQSRHRAEMQRTWDKLNDRKPGVFRWLGCLLCTQGAASSDR